MDMKIESKTTIELDAFFDGKTLKSHNCELGGWYSDNICHRIDITDAIEESAMAKGQYKIIITLEKE